MLLKCDAHALEWRSLAWLANDQVALEELRGWPEYDVHAVNQKHFNLPKRLIAKIYLFRTIYRGSGWAFAHDPMFMHVSSDPDFWDDLNLKFYKKYKGIDQCHHQWARTVASRKPIVSPFGREWIIPLKDDGKLPWTKLTNYPNQGTGNDLMAIARCSLHRRLQALGLPSSSQAQEPLLVSTVHDDIKMDVPEDQVEPIAKLMYQVFDDIPKNVKKLWGIDLPIPFPCEVSAGKNLQDLTPVPR
jgi:DNA polymerase I-like protein with 3'-5' exonuclease and polymerase domains